MNGNGSKAQGGNGHAPDRRKRVAIYTRKSTAHGLEQDFSSLDAQREACERYVEGQAHLGWEVLPERYDDGGFTGANLERPAFRRLLADIDAGKIDVVVVYKVDRLSRSLLDFARVMDRFNRAGVAFVSVTQNFSTADAMGRLTLDMLMSFAEFEREMIAERTRDKIAAARRRGKWTGGPVPLGYDVVDKKLVVNELEALVVREAFELYLEHRSVLAVARLLNERGRTTKRHRSRRGRTREGKAWTKDAVLRLLRNPIYGGYMPCRGELHEGEHQPIVDRETFARVRALLDRSKGKRPAARTSTARSPAGWTECSRSDEHGRRPRAVNPEYILRGLLRCAPCGKAMTPASTRKKGKVYRYYRCVTRDKEGRDACDARPLPAEAIERFVVERIREATRSGLLAREVERRLAERLAREREKLETERAELPRQIASLSAEGKRLVDLVATAAGPARRMLEERLQEVGATLARCEARLADVERELAALDETEVEGRWVAQTLADFDAVWDALTPENRGRLVRALVREVLVDEPSGTVTAVLAEPWAEDGDPGLAPEAPPTRPSPAVEALP